MSNDLPKETRVKEQALSTCCSNSQPLATYIGLSPKPAWSSSGNWKGHRLFTEFTLPPVPLYVLQLQATKDSCVPLRYQKIWLMSTKPLMNLGAGKFPPSSQKLMAFLKRSRDNQPNKSNQMHPCPQAKTVSYANAQKWQRPPGSKQ